MGRKRTNPPKRKRLRVSPARKSAPTADGKACIGAEPEEFIEEDNNDPSSEEEAQEPTPPTDGLSMRLKLGSIDAIPREFDIKALVTNVHLSAKGGMNFTHGGSKHAVLRNHEGDLVPFNESRNLYAQKLIGYMLQEFTTYSKDHGNKVANGTKICKSVLVDELKYIHHIVGIPHSQPITRIQETLYNLMTGFCSGEPFNYRLRGFACIFMEVRTSLNPKRLYEMEAFNKACDVFWTNEVKQNLPEEPHVGWRTILMKLLNGHLAHNGLPEIPFGITPESAKQARKLQNKNDQNVSLEGQKLLRGRR
jgi:hypothetical protein